MNLAKKIREIGLSDKILSSYKESHQYFALRYDESPRNGDLPASLSDLRYYLTFDRATYLKSLSNSEIKENAYVGAFFGALTSSFCLSTLALWEFLRYGTLKTDILDILVAGGGLTVLSTLAVIVLNECFRYRDTKESAEEFREDFLLHIRYLRRKDGESEGVGKEDWPELDAYHVLAESYFKERRREAMKNSGIDPDLYQKHVLNRDGKL